MRREAPMPPPLRQQAVPLRPQVEHAPIHPLETNPQQVDLRQQARMEMERLQQQMRRRQQQVQQQMQHKGAQRRQSVQTQQQAPPRQARQQQAQTSSPEKRRSNAAAKTCPNTIRALFANKNSVRQGIIMHEILGKPKGLEGL